MYFAIYSAPASPSSHAWVHFVRWTAIPLAVWLTFSLAKRWFPAQSGPRKPTIPNLGPIASAWTLLSAVLYIGCGLFMVLGTVRAAEMVNRVLALRHGPAEFLFTPTAAWWYLYAGFFGLCFTWFVVSPIMRSIMGSRQFNQWTMQGDQRVGFNSARMLRVIAFVIMIPYTLLFIPSLFCHTRFSQEDIGIQHYAELRETNRRYSGVAQAAVVRGWLDRSGTFHNDPRIVLRFKDGMQWSSRNDFRDPEKVNSNLIAFISQKTGLQFQIANLESDLP